jgi:hypothetical protein
MPANMSAKNWLSAERCVAEVARAQRESTFSIVAFLGWGLA